MGERPVECTQCSKPIRFLYKEIVGGGSLCSEMCAECPLLQQKLYGKERGDPPPEGEALLCCGNCHTSLDALKRGGPLGCSRCYEVFEGLLTKELIAREEIPARLRKQLATHKNQSIHVGKAPGEHVQLPPSSKLATLNEALNEALGKENYEQAAWLRDQIQALREEERNGQE